MEEERTHGWIWLVAAATVVGAAVFVLSPWWSITSLAKALQAEDQPRVTLYVDFPRVRESLPAQLKEVMNESFEKDGDDSPAAGFGSLLGAVVIDRAVDAFATPEGISRLLRKRLEEQDAQAPGKGSGRLEAAQRLRDRVDLEWLSSREIKATVRDPASSDSTTVLLEREGLLRWRVVDVEIPEMTP